MTYTQLSQPIDWFFLGEKRECAIKALSSYCKGRMSGPPEGRTRQEVEPQGLHPYTR